MRVLVLVLCVVLGCSLGAGNVKNFFAQHQHGDATWYDLADFAEQGNGACSLNKPGIPAIGKVWRTVALQDLYRNGSPYACGMCVQLVGSDGSGDDPVGGPHIAIVTDHCDTCPGQGDIDINAKSKDGRWDLEWRAVTCPSSIGKLQYAYRGAHRGYIKLQIRNHRVPIKSVRAIIGARRQNMKLSDDNFWIWNFSGDTGIKYIPKNIKVVIQTWDGQTIQGTLPKNQLPKQPQDKKWIGPFQFPGGKQFKPWRLATAGPVSAPGGGGGSGGGGSGGGGSGGGGGGGSTGGSLVNFYLNTQSGPTWNYEAFPGGKCELNPVPPFGQSGIWRTVAVAPSVFQAGDGCGMCLRVSGSFGTKTVFVNDLCEKCDTGMLNFNGSPVSGNVEWTAVDCPGASQSNNKLQYKSSYANDHYIKFQVRNNRAPVQAVYALNIGGSARIKLPTSSVDMNQFWVYEASAHNGQAIPATITIEVESVDGSIVQDQIQLSQLKQTGTPFNGLGRQLPAITGSASRSTSETAGLPEYEGSEFSGEGYALDGESIVTTTAKSMSTEGSLIRWDGSRGAMDKYTTIHKVIIEATHGTVGIAMRTGQGEYADDRLEWRFTNIDEDKATLEWCPVHHGSVSCKKVDHVSFASDSPVEVTVMMGFDDSTGEIVSTIRWQHNAFDDYDYDYEYDSESDEYEEEEGESYSYTKTVAEDQFPELGVISFYVNSPGARLSELRAATTSTLTVELDECVDDWEWEEIFYELTGVDPLYTDIDIQNTGGNRACASKAAEHGKALASSMTFVVTSLGETAPSISQSFVAAGSGPAGAASGINSVGAIGGSAGASAAGVPSGAAAAGGGGGGAGGLSGGAIAGIVLGSVGGAVLLVGVSGLLVGAAVVAVVAVSRGGDDDVSPATPAEGDGRRRSSIRRRISRLFGGVNVMNPTPGVHQSITARSPPVRT